jgi:hypothetical protein
MRRIGWIVFGVVLVFAGAGGAQKDANKLPDAVRTALEKAGELEVYSLNGETKDEDGWHGSKVLGKTTVKKEAATKLAGALAKGVTEGERGARCFIPRHGVRATYNGKTYDLVICFECGWVYVYTDKSDKPLVLMISTSPNNALNKILTDAKVPLTKPEKEKAKEKDK